MCFMTKHFVRNYLNNLLCKSWYHGSMPSLNQECHVNETNTENLSTKKKIVKGKKKEKNI